MKSHPAAADHTDLDVDSEEDKRDLEELMAEAEQHSQNASLMAYSGEGSLTGASGHHQVWSPTVNFALFTQVSKQCHLPYRFHKKRHPKYEQ